MASAVRVMACLVLIAACIVASTDAAINCATVSTKLAPCLGYLQNGGAVPTGCCDGARSLLAMAQTKPDRQQACQCVASAARGITGIKPDLAAALPRTCGINIPFPIGSATNCNSIN